MLSPLRGGNQALDLIQVGGAQFQQGRLVSGRCQPQVSQPGQVGQAPRLQSGQLSPGFILPFRELQWRDRFALGAVAV